jgi:hypothetical protein
MTNSNSKIDIDALLKEVKENFQSNATKLVREIDDKLRAQLLAEIQASLQKFRYLTVCLFLDYNHIVYNKSITIFMNSTSTYSFDNNDMNEIDFEFSSSSIYHNLHYLNSIEQLMKDREEMLSHKDALTEMNGCENLNDLLLYGLSEEEVDNLKNIDETIIKGKALLLNTLKEYNECKNNIHEINKNIHITEKSIINVKKQLECLTDVHDELQEISDEFLTKLLEKKEEIISSMQTDAGLLIVNRDKLEAIIRSLGATYSVIKNTPMHHTCPICITHEVDIYLEPCGHTLCKSCSTAQNQHCHMCRTKIKSRRNIYYS